MKEDSGKPRSNRTGTERYLAFTLSQERFAIPLLAVKEVVAMPETTRVPHTPPHFLGIMNLRGQIISVFDLRLKLGLPAETGAETSVIICDFAPLCFGVVVNSVDSVMALTSDDIAERPEIESRMNSEYITGVTKSADRLVLLLNLAKALNVDDHLAMRHAANQKVA
jgi:purine-binding chemotaxis protein CheW